MRGPAAGNQRNDGKAAPHRVLESQGHFFTDHGAHAAAHEPVIEHGEHHVAAVDFAGSGNGGFGQAGAVLALDELVVVGRPVGEGQRRNGAHIAVVLSEGAAVREQLDPLTGRQSVVETAERTNAEVEVGVASR